jgi:hypothetical protein
MAREEAVVKGITPWFDDPRWKALEISDKTHRTISIEPKEVQG